MQGITFHEPFGYLDYNHLQMNARCVISDSGTISEESAIIGFPAVSFRDSIERPESLDAGSIVLAGIEPENLINSILIACEYYSDSSIDKEQPAGYQENNFSQKVVSFLVSTALKHAEWGGIRSIPWRKKAFCMLGDFSI